MLLKNNVRAKTKVIKEHNSFIKESKCDVSFLFERYTYFYDCISEIDGIYTPKIKGIHDGNMEFEYIDLGLSLKEIIETGTYDKDLFRLLGKGLGELHLKLNDGVVPEDGMICGDFCTWNIFVKDGDIYFIDFEPPFRVLHADVSNQKFLSESSYMEDIGQFMFRLDNILIPTKPLLFLKSFEKEKELFLSGYEEATNKVIAQDELNKVLKCIAKKEVSFEKNFQNTFTYLVTKVLFICKYKI